MKKSLIPLLVIFLSFLFASPVLADGEGGEYVDALFTQSSEFARVIVIGISIAFGVGFMLNLSRAQLARGTGDSMGFSRSLQQGIGMVILLALAANVELIAVGLRTIGSGIDADPSSSVLLTGVWEQLAKFFTSSILGGIGVYTTVSAIGSGMAGHVSTIIGSPTGLSNTISNGVVLIGGGILTLMSVLVANSILTTVF
jgi:hypothetical protein